MYDDTLSDPGVGDVQAPPFWHGPFPPLLSHPVPVWQRWPFQPLLQSHLYEEPSAEPGAGDVQVAPFLHRLCPPQ